MEMLGTDIVMWVNLKFLLNLLKYVQLNICLFYVLFGSKIVLLCIKIKTQIFT